MDFKAVNSAIINGKDVTSSFKTKEFYQYLLDNNVAYYYSKIITLTKGKTEKKILARGEEFNTKYIKTLREIYEASKVGGIDFVLFKTFKHVSEVVDGDIDIFVKGKDFDKFIDILQKRGFECTKETNFKAFCLREGFCKVEPRTDISFYGKTLIPEEVVWRYLIKETIYNIDIQRTSIELDVCYFLLNTLFGPNYIRLYHYLLVKKVDDEKLYPILGNSPIKEDLKLMMKTLRQENVYKKRFPFFIGNCKFLSWWLRRILLESEINLLLKAENLLFFFYSKYGYFLFGYLPFRHDWNIF